MRQSGAYCKFFIHSLVKCAELLLSDCLPDHFFCLSLNSANQFWATMIFTLPAALRKLLNNNEVLRAGTDVHGIKIEPGCTNSFQRE